MSQLSFQYTAIDRKGAQQKGELRAATRQDAYRRLSTQGLTPLKLKERSLRTRKGFISPQRIRSADVAHFTHQLSVLLEARLPVVDCFLSIADQEPNEQLKRILLDVAGRIQSGCTITECIEAHSSVFGTVYVETVRAAERSGNMIEVLAHLAEMVEEHEEMKRTVKGALMYPLLVTAALALAIAFLLTVVVPRFATMFVERGVDLPALTKLLMAIGTSIRSWWWLYLVVIAGSIFAARRAWRSPRGRLVIDEILARVPHLRRLLSGLAVGRFASVFGLSLSSGLGLLESLELGGRSAGRPLLMRDVQLLMEQVRRGGRLGEALRDCSYFPGFVKQLLSAGEESAELSRMCRVVARHYARETKHLAKNAATLMEPILIAGLTTVVLVVALAIFVPIWDMASVLE